MTVSAIEFKGTSFTISVIQLVDSDMNTLALALSEKIAQAPAFFKNAPVVVNISQLQASIDYHELQQSITSSGLNLVGITGHLNADEKKRIQTAGLAVISAGKQQTQPRITESAPKSEVQEQKQPKPNPPKVIRGQIRSGQQVYAKEADLIVIGNVSNGAEAIADGDIHVYGTLRGRAIAGASGQTACGVYCQRLQAELVSVAGHYQVSDSLQSHWGEACSIQLIEQQIKIAPLN